MDLWSGEVLRGTLTGGDGDNVKLDSRVLGLREQYERCVSDAMSQSVDSVANSNLKRYHLYGKRAELIASN